MRRILLISAFIEGGMVMMLELSYPHIITPVYGNSVYIWAIALCLSVLSLAGGYFLGGFLNKKSEHKSRNLARLFALSAISITLSQMLLIILNSSFSIGDEILVWSIIMSGLVIPLLSFGATTPLIIGILQQEQHFEAGKIYSISTYGGLLFSLLTGYLLLPEIGITKTTWIAVVLIGIVLVLLSRSIGKKRFRYLGISCSLIAFYFLVVPNELPQAEKMKVLYMEEGLNGQLMVADLKDSTLDQRLLFINRMGQTWVDKNSGFSTWSYPNLITALASMYAPESKSLVLGLGGGIIAKQLRQFTGHKVEAVELDQRIVDIAYTYFDLPSYGIDVHHGDARVFLNQSSDKYDFIVFDIFNGEIAPSHGLSVEAFTTAKACLNKNGLIAINFNGFQSGNEGASGKALIATLKEAGFHVQFVHSLEEKEADRNTIYLAYLNEPNWKKINVNINTSTGQFFIHEHLNSTEGIQGQVVTDDLPIMELLNYPAASSWRKSYYENFTKKYKEQGIGYVK